jgi:hypothetical protein
MENCSLKIAAYAENPESRRPKVGREALADLEAPGRLLRPGAVARNDTPGPRLHRGRCRKDTNVAPAHGFAVGVHSTVATRAFRAVFGAAEFESQKFSNLAATSQPDRRSHLGPNGPVAGVLGSKRVDEITADTLVDWWEAFRDTWRRIVGRADLPGVRIKDLRDTFASQLLTVGIPIQWVSRQLGHGGVSITERHYAKYLGVGGDEFVYVEPLRLEPGEVPADLLSRLQDCSQNYSHGFKLVAHVRARLDARDELRLASSAGPIRQGIATGSRDKGRRSRAQ